MDIVHTAPEDPRDWWTEEDWEMCEMGLCDDGDDDWPCPCSTVPRNRGDP